MAVLFGKTNGTGRPQNLKKTSFHILLCSQTDVEISFLLQLTTNQHFSFPICKVSIISSFKPGKAKLETVIIWIEKRSPIHPSQRKVLKEKGYSLRLSSGVSCRGCRWSERMDGYHQWNIWTWIYTMLNITFPSSFPLTHRLIYLLLFQLFIHHASHPISSLQPSFFSFSSQQSFLWEKWWRNGSTAYGWAGYKGSDGVIHFARVD